MKSPAFILLPMLALSSPCAFAADAAPPLAIDCDHVHLPAQQAFARVAGIDNFGQAYAARARTMVRVERMCQQGTSTVLLVTQPASPSQDSKTALAQR